MMGSEILCLQWNEFQSNLRSSYKDLRNSVDFSDVTLVCEDGQRIDAHRLVLSSSSGFFKDLLLKLTHPQPLVFMRGLTYPTLAAMVNFIYLGEVYKYKKFQTNTRNYKYDCRYIDLFNNYEILLQILLFAQNIE